jgi:hypothetical protein
MRHVTENTSVNPFGIKLHKYSGTIGLVMMCSVENKKRTETAQVVSKLIYLNIKTFISSGDVYDDILKSLFSFTVTSSIDIVCKHGSFPG